MIISLAFVGGMFSAVYAGSVIATITLDGNVHTTGDSIVDGDLSVGGVSFAALEARVASLEGSTVPMVVANEAMIATHDTMILSNQADIATNAQAIAEGGGGPSACDSDGDGALTAQELVDFFGSHGITLLTSNVQNTISNIEGIVEDNVSGTIDTPGEIARWNADMNFPYGIPEC